MAPTPQKTKLTRAKQQQAARMRTNIIPALSVIILGILALFDLRTPGETVPNIIYYGLIGSTLGAKYEDIIDYIRGGKK